MHTCFDVVFKGQWSLVDRSAVDGLTAVEGQTVFVQDFQLSLRHISIKKVRRTKTIRLSSYA